MEWHSAIDYLRVSYDIGGIPNADRYIDARIQSMVARLAGNRMPVLPVVAGSLRGYRIDGYGYSVLRDIVRDKVIEVVSGQTCKQWDAPPLSVTLRASRIDVAIDVLLDEYDNVDAAINRCDNHLDDMYDMYISLRESRVKDWYKRNITRITNAKGGTTVYIGSRFSDVFMRLYNKTAEWMHVDQWITHQSIVRYELELKGKAIDQWNVADYVMADRLDELAYLLSAWMIERYRLPITVRDKVSTRWYRAPSRDNELDKKLRWLRQYVIPSIRLLASNGYGDELRLLGIEWIGGYDEQQKSLSNDD